MSMKPYITPEKRQNIADDLKVGESWNTISQRYDVSYSTIRRIKKTLEGGSENMSDKKSPEAVPTPIEPASEEIIDSGASADTNIIADVPEDVKKEAPIETLSRAFNALSEHIAQSFGSSAEEYSPYNSIVDEAVLERMENINFKIAQLKSEISVYEFELSKLNDYHTKYLEETENGKAG